MIRDNKLYGLFLALFVFTLPGYSLTGRIQGFLPGKENTKLYVSYFPPGPDNTKFSDSCIIDSEAKFEFITPFNEPVMAALHADFMRPFYFMTDTGVVKIIAVYPGKNFSISQIQAVSPTNKEYSAYKEFIRPESSFTDFLNNISNKLQSEKRSDSVELPAPSPESADNLSVTKTYAFVKKKAWKLCCKGDAGLQKTNVTDTSCRAEKYFYRT